MIRNAPQILGSAVQKRNELDRKGVIIAWRDQQRAMSVVGMSIIPAKKI